MYIIPAIDLIDGNAVRLTKGDYEKVTVYSHDPVEVAKTFQEKGSRFLHIVDLDGAKTGNTANFKTIERIISHTSLSVEVGGGIRNMETLKRYAEIGVDRMILGTAAITEPLFLKEAIQRYPNHIVVGVDIKDGRIATNGWTEVSEQSCFDFCQTIQNFGVKTIVCTDISKDGMMSGTNRELYKELSKRFTFQIIASGGISDKEDIRNLAALHLFGAILGKALYTGAIDLSDAIAIAEKEII